MDSHTTNAWREALLAELVPHAVHRLGNLLTVVLGTADLLAMSESDSERLVQLNAVCDGARRSTELIRALGNHARSVPEPAGALDLSYQFTSIFELLHPVATASGCELLPFESLGMTLIETDAVRLQLLALGILVGECRPLESGRRQTTMQVRAIELGTRVVLMATTKAMDGAPLPDREIPACALALAENLSASIKVSSALKGHARVVTIGFSALV